MPDASAPLGVFDSGLGGLTVVHALLEALPYENIIYLGDTARVPYGTRSAETVVRYAKSCARVLTDRGIKALVVACNTVSAVALEVLRAELDLPVVGVVVPGAKPPLPQQEPSRRPAASAVRIGVLGTQGTIGSGAYPRAVSQLSTRLEVDRPAGAAIGSAGGGGLARGTSPGVRSSPLRDPVGGSWRRRHRARLHALPALKATIERVAERSRGGPCRSSTARWQRRTPWRS